MLLSNAGSRLSGRNGDIEDGQVPVGHGPCEQTANLFALDAAGRAEPGVEVGLGEGGPVASGVGEPGEERLRCGELLLGLDQRAVGKRPAAGLGPHPR